MRRPNNEAQRLTGIQGLKAAARWEDRALPVLILLLALLSLPLCASAQSYSIDWYKIAGGGGTSTDAVCAVSGTIGQPDASGTMTNRSYALTGAFWSFIGLVQVSGVPNLTITHAGNSVIVSWPNTGSYTLQQSNNLAAAGGWATSGFIISTASGTNSITITPPTGILFFRLANP